MAAPTTAARVKKSLANPKPSTHGPSRRFPNLAHVGSRPKPKSARLLDHLVGGRQQRFRDGKAERLGGIEVDDQFDFYELLDRQIGWFLALENASDINGSSVIQIADAAAIA